jgi:hypothetical protein
MDSLRPANEIWSGLAHDLIRLLTPKTADIWTSPSKVAVVIDICRALEPIGKEAENVGITLALQEKEIPGYSLVRRERTGYLESGAIVNLLESLSVRDFVRALPEILAWSGNVSERRYIALCELLNRQPDKTLIKPSGDTLFLRKNPQTTTP